MLLLENKTQVLKLKKKLILIWLGTHFDRTNVAFYNDTCILNIIYIWVLILVVMCFKTQYTWYMIYLINSIQNGM